LSNSLFKLEQKICTRHTRIVFDILVLFLVFVALLWKKENIKGKCKKRSAQNKIKNIKRKKESVASIVSLVL
jgi:cell division protein FtsI/penicillin-binding protein 2